MTESQARAIVAILLAAYPRADWPKETRRVYGHAVQPFEFAETERIVERLVATHDWPPSIAELRRAIVEARLGLPDEVSAWEMALRHADARRPGAPRVYCVACAATGRIVGGDLCPDCDGTGDLDELDLDRMPPAPDPIPAAVRAVGGWRTIRESERPEHLRRDFLDAYRRLRAQTVERENLRMLGADGDSALVSAAVAEIEAP